MRTDILLLQDMLDAINEVLENTPSDPDAYLSGLSVVMGVRSSFRNSTSEPSA